MVLTEIKRKAFHFTGLVIPIGYYVLGTFTSEEQAKFIAIRVMLGFNVFYFLAELIRFVSPTMRRIFLRYFGPLLRREEHQRITGTAYYLIGALLSILFFRKPFAIVCLCFLIIGDFFAALVGVHMGRTKLVGSKSLEGSLACFIACFVVAFLLLVNPGVLAPSHESFDWYVVAAGALAATLAELFPLGINDNLMIPLVSGLVMTIVVTVPH